MKKKIIELIDKKLTEICDAHYGAFEEKARLKIEIKTLIIALTLKE